MNGSKKPDYCIFFVRPLSSYRTGLLVALLLKITVPIPLLANDSLPEGVRVQNGWPIVTSAGVNSTLTIGDIDFDGQSEVVFGDFNGNVYLVESDGTLLAGWPRQFPGEVFFDRAALADVDGNGTLEIFIASGFKIHGLDWRGNTLDGWPQPSPGLLGFGVFIGGPSIADLNSDGSFEIVAVSNMGRIFVWKTNGDLAPGWSQDLPVLREFTPPGTVAGPALGDIDQDGKLEIVISSTGSVHVYEHNGNIFPGWPVVMDDGRVILGPPALGNLVGDKNLEIIVGTSNGRTTPARVFAFRNSGKLLPGWPQDVASWVNGGVALGDVDGDNKLEVVAATIDEKESIYIWNGEDGSLLPGWPQGTFENFVAFSPSPSIGDIDGDGQVDIVNIGTQFLNLSALFAWHLDGTLITQEPVIFEHRDTTRSIPTMVDIDKDGDIEIGFGFANSSNAFSPGEVFFLDFPGTFDPSTLEWPTLSHDVARTGRYRPLVENIPFPPTVAPPVIHLRNPPHFLTTSVRIPKDFPKAPIFFWIMKAGGKNILPIRALEPRSPRAFGGRVQVFRFDGNWVAEALRTRFPSLEEPRGANLRLVSSTRQGKRLIGVARIQIIP